MQRNPLSWLPWIIPRLRIEGRHGFSTLAVCHLLLHPIALGSELSPLELLASIPHSRPRLAFNRTDPTRGAAAPKPRNRTVFFCPRIRDAAALAGRPGLRRSRPPLTASQPAQSRREYGRS